MTFEEVELLEQRHALLDLDEDSVHEPFPYALSPDGVAHFTGFVHHPEGN